MWVGELPQQGAVMRLASGRAPPPDLQTLIPALKVAVVTHRPSRLVSSKVILKAGA
jgi:hypothetical protein